MKIKPGPSLLNRPEAGSSPSDCPEDDEYRNYDFQLVFYDDWASMPTGGVFTPGFGILATLAAIFIAFRDDNNVKS